MRETNCNEDSANAIAESIFSLSLSPDHNNVETQRQKSELPPTAQFEESLYVADEKERMETYIAVKFPEDRPDAAFDTHLVCLDEPFVSIIKELRQYLLTSSFSVISIV